MPILRESKRNKDGTFAVGNGGGPGVPPIRERYDARLRYRWEAPEHEQPPVPMTRADRDAMKTLRSLDAIEEGPEFVRNVKAVAEIAYGTKSAQDLNGVLRIEDDTSSAKVPVK